MGEVTVFRPWHNHNKSLMLTDTAAHFSIGRDKPKQQYCHLLLMRRKPLTAMAMVTPSTYSSTITTDIPLFESPSASFDSYLDHKPRVFKAIFPDKRRSKRLNEEEWRINMLPIQFLFLNARLIIDMRLRCKSKGKDYPAGVPCDITKVLELKIIRWNLQGVDEILKPSQFSLGVDGALYPDRHGKESRLKGQLQIRMSFVHPPVLALVPDYIHQDVAESMLKRLVENMKEKVNGSLLADYSEFKREKSMLTRKKT